MLSHLKKHHQQIMLPAIRHLLNHFDTERIAFRLTTSYRRIEQLEKQEPKKYFTVAGGTFGRILRTVIMIQVSRPVPVE